MRLDFASLHASFIREIKQETEHYNKKMAISIFSNLWQSSATPSSSIPPFPYNFKTNPYHAKRTWPPDFSQLSAKHQFRLERRYRRRTKLKWARPGWTKGVKLAQWGAILFVGVYGVGFMEIERVDIEGQTKTRTVFDGIREWMGKQVGEIEGRKA